MSGVSMRQPPERKLNLFAAAFFRSRTEWGMPCRKDRRGFVAYQTANVSAPDGTERSAEMSSLAHVAGRSAARVATMSRCLPREGGFKWLWRFPVAGDVAVCGGIAGCTCGRAGCSDHTDLNGIHGNFEDWSRKLKQISRHYKRAASGENRRKPQRCSVSYGPDASGVSAAPGCNSCCSAP